MKRFQLTETGGKEFKAALKGEDDIILFDGEVAVARVLPVSAKARAVQGRGVFMHYPHAPNDCMGTCWRHSNLTPESEKTKV